MILVLSCCLSFIGGVVIMFLAAAKTMQKAMRQSYLDGYRDAHEGLLNKYDPDTPVCGYLGKGGRI